MSTISPVDLGENIEDSEKAAKKLAREIYEAFPVNDSRGQHGKNVLIGELFSISGRMRQAAMNYFEIGKLKPISKDQWSLPSIPTTPVVEDEQHPWTEVDKDGNFIVHIPADLLP